MIQLRLLPCTFLRKFEPNPSTLDEVMAVFSIIQDGGRPPFWYCSDVTRQPAISISQWHACVKISCKYFTREWRY